MHIIIIISQGIIFFSDSCNHYMGYVYLCLSSIVYCFFIPFSILFHLPIFIQSSNLGQEWLSFSCCSASQTSVIHSCEVAQGVLVSTSSNRRQSLCLACRCCVGRAGEAPGSSSLLLLSTHSLAAPAGMDTALWTLHAWLEVPEGKA